MKKTTKRKKILLFILLLVLTFTPQCAIAGEVESTGTMQSDNLEENIILLGGNNGWSTLSQRTIDNLLDDFEVEVICSGHGGGHANKTFDYIDGSATAGSPYWNRMMYKCDVTVNASKYVAAYDTFLKTTGHKLTNQNQNNHNVVTMVLKKDGWELENKNAKNIKFHVDCDGGTNPESPLSNFDHIDVKFATTLILKSGDETKTINGTIDKSTLKVSNVNGSEYSFANASEQNEKNGQEFHRYIKLPSNLDVKNFLVTCEISFKGSDVNKLNPELKRFFTDKTNENVRVSGDKYILSYSSSYTGINECTGGNGMRSAGNTGNASGYDLYITSENILQTLNPTFTVKWHNWNDEVLETDEEVKAGTIPSYDKANNPSREKDGVYTYAFLGWSLDKENVITTFEGVTKNLDFYALYDATPNAPKEFAVNANVKCIRTGSNHQSKVYPVASEAITFKEIKKDTQGIFTTEATIAKAEIDRLISAYNVELKEAHKRALIQGETASFEVYFDSQAKQWKLQGSVPEIKVVCQKEKEKDLNTFSLNYDANGGTGAPSSDTVVTEETGYTFTVKSEIPSKNGARFLGWADEAKAINPNYKPDDKITLEINAGTLAATKTVYAVWEPIFIPYVPPYTPTTVYYNVLWNNYDDVNLEKDRCTIGEMPVYNGQTPSKASDDNFTYKFTGWDKEIEKVYKDVTYTACFEAVPKEIITEPPVKDRTPKEDNEVIDLTVRTKVPKTSDSQRLSIWMLIALIAASGLGVLGYRYKKR